MKRFISLFRILLLSAVLFAQNSSYNQLGSVGYLNSTQYIDPTYKVESYSDNDELLLGNPSKATTNEVYQNNYLLRKDGFSISYNNVNHIPNWVAWHLSSENVGTAERYDGNFYPDLSLPNGWYRVTHNSYTGSGFDRGHMCPNADRNITTESSKVTFVTTNIIPQSIKNNQVVWNNLESVEQDLAREGKEMYIYSGPIGIGGVSTSNKVVNYIASSATHDKGVLVPESTWKIILVLPRGSSDISRINVKDAYVIAVIIPNTLTCHSDAEAKGFTSKSDWKYYITTVDEIESITGYDFFTELPDEIEETLESTKYKD